ncbi:hypothetical protein Acr_06g0009870 [Actinidia rufa]|uniref:Uncharacterized protein n=1 Tax=Actinidia rufa TaxID=165716 RepID=A0A7J0ETZ2_9ERIC|nr:hypothetical protein Acr_06g0009870 [Actinidia rufa]
MNSTTSPKGTEHRRTFILQSPIAFRETNPLDRGKTSLTISTEPRQAIYLPEPPQSARQSPARVFYPSASLLGSITDSPDGASSPREQIPGRAKPHPPPAEDRTRANLPQPVQPRKLRSPSSGSANKKSHQDEKAPSNLVNSNPIKKGEEPPQRTAVYREDIMGSDFIKVQAPRPARYVRRKNRPDGPPGLVQESDVAPRLLGRGYVQSVLRHSEGTRQKSRTPSDKVIIMAMMEGLRPGPLFDSLSKNVPENLSALQSKADKYIAAEELAEAKRRRRGKDDHNKRKEPDTRRADYREETRYKRPDRDPKRSNNRRPRTPPRRPEFILPPLNTPVAQVLSEIKHEEFVKWPVKIKTESPEEKQKQILRIPPGPRNTIPRTVFS